MQFVATLAEKGHSSVFCINCRKILKHKLSCSTKFLFFLFCCNENSKTFVGIFSAKASGELEVCVCECVWRTNWELFMNILNNFDICCWVANDNSRSRQTVNRFAADELRLGELKQRNYIRLFIIYASIALISLARCLRIFLSACLPASTRCGSVSFRFVSFASLFFAVLHPLLLLTFVGIERQE